MSSAAHLDLVPAPRVSQGRAVGGGTPRVPGRSGGLAVRLGYINTLIDKMARDLADPAQEVRGSEVQELDRTIRRLEAAKLTLIAKADRQGAHRLSGASSTSSWVAGLTKAGGSAASRDVSLATTLEADLPATRAALGSGEVSRTNASIIADTMTRLPEDLTERDRAAVEGSLVRDGKRLDPGRLRKVATRALAAAERSAAEAAAHEEELLVDRERRAYARSSITLHDHGDGTTTGRFTLPTGSAQVLRKVLQSMTAPRRNHLSTQAKDRLGDGETCSGESSDGSVAGEVAAERSLGGRNADWDSISWQEKRGRAFADLLEHLPTDRLTGKVASTIVVTMTLEQVLGAARAAVVTEAAGLDPDSIAPSVGATRTDTGHEHSTSQARRLACNAGILPLVLGGASVPLDLGRQERFFSEAQRTTLAARYDECAAVGCDRPFAWTELHHEDPWSRQGRTDLDKALPLCGFHHRRIHDPGYTHAMRTDEHGRKCVAFHARR
jgi:hypothetical protein